MNEPLQGSCDFFYEASELLTESDTPHIMLAGLSGHDFSLQSYNLTSESFPWFKHEMLRFLDMLEEEFVE